MFWIAGTSCNSKVKLQFLKTPILAAASGSEGMSPPPLEYKKWGLQDQVDSVDHITCGRDNKSTPNYKWITKKNTVWHDTCIQCISTVTVFVTENNTFGQNINENKTSQINLV